jgi:hypothetical protein
MSTQEHQFVCRACGCRESPKRIDYDVLGYAICPACDAREGPS